MPRKGTLQRLPVWVNEPRWREATDPGPLANMLAELLRFKIAGVSARKLRLAETACARRVADLFPTELGRRAIELAWRMADDSAECDGLLHEVFRTSQTAEAQTAPFATSPATRTNLVVAECDCALQLLRSNQQPEELGRRPASLLRLTDFSLSRFEERKQLALIRDIFGNPFRPVTFASAWRTDTVRAIARQMYESRDFSAMPILADALQDAGCDRAEVLDHCRDTSQVHVRGCWVVDLVLGKN